VKPIASAEQVTLAIMLEYLSVFIPDIIIHITPSTIPTIVSTLIVTIIGPIISPIISQCISHGQDIISHAISQDITLIGTEETTANKT